jgi:hypothetical protein
VTEVHQQTRGNCKIVSMLVCQMVWMLHPWILTTFWREF